MYLVSFSHFSTLQDTSVRHDDTVIPDVYKRQGGYCICYSVLFICVGDGSRLPHIIQYQECIRAFRAMSPLQIIVFLDDTPRQDIDFSRDVMGIIFGFLRINYIAGIVDVYKRQREIRVIRA